MLLNSGYGKDLFPEDDGPNFERVQKIWASHIKLLITSSGSMPRKALEELGNAVLAVSNCVEAARVCYLLANMSLLDVRLFAELWRINLPF